MADDNKQGLLLRQELAARFKAATPVGYVEGLQGVFGAGRAMGMSKPRAALAVWDHMQRDQPGLVAELGGLWRGGRDDFVMLLLGMNLSAAPGAPGQPTQAIITQGLTGQEVNPMTERMGAAAGNDFAEMVRGLTGLPDKVATTLTDAIKAQKDQPVTPPAGHEPEQSQQQSRGMHM